MTCRLIYWPCLLMIIMHSLAGQDSTDTFLINPDNTKIEFKAKHFGVINVSGTFKAFQGQLQVRDNIIVSAKITLNVKSITTDNKSRDKSLKDEGFLDANGHPFITLDFENNHNLALIASQVKVKGTTKPVPIVYSVTQLNDTTRLIEANCEINRQLFLLDLGSMDDLVSDKIQVRVFITLKVK